MMPPSAGRLTPAKSRRDEDSRPRRLRQMVALPGGAVATIGFFSILVGLLYVSGLLGVTGSPGSALLRRALLWGGPAALVASAVGGYVAAWLAGGTPRAAIMTGLVSVALTLTITVTLVDISAGDAIDFHSVLVALGVEKPARLPVEAMPAAVKDSMTSRSAVAEPSEVAIRRTRGAIGWLGFFIISLLAAGAVGGGASASRHEPATQRN